MILHRAGMVVWPKLFQNMRASCETDGLNEGHPAHVVAAFTGHSITVQRESYAQVTDGHFEAFCSLSVGHHKNDSDSGSDEVRNDEKGRESSDPMLNQSPATTQKAPKNTGSPGLSSSGGGTRISTENAGKTAASTEGAAECAAIQVSWGEVRDSIAACPDLPTEARKSLIDAGDAAARKHGPDSCSAQDSGNAPLGASEFPQ